MYYFTKSQIYYFRRSTNYILYTGSQVGTYTNIYYIFTSYVDIIMHLETIFITFN